MIDYYKTLGVPKTASQDEIKKAYRKLAAKHHPDRGGDTAEFQKLEEAYRILGDETARSEYDNPQPQFQFRTENMDDIFGAFFRGQQGPFGFGGFNQRQMRKNKNINIRIQMTLKDILTGKDFVGSIKLPSGREQLLQLKIPKGVSAGDAIRYQGMGDDSIPNLPKGDLVAAIEEIPHPTFERQGPNIVTNITISVFDAMLGASSTIQTLDESTLEVTIPAGITHGTVLSCNGYGLPKGTNQDHRGNMYIRVNLKVPSILDERDKQVIEVLKGKYAN
jgi:curved DNA-binding protein